MKKIEWHGMSGSPEYKAWEKMKARCADKTVVRYGGRGVTVCREWNDSFLCFYRDMGPRPSKNHSIDRINNDLGYFLENCRWATPVQQANNTCTNTAISAFGKTQTLTMWACEIGIHRNTLWNRIYRARMPIEQALTPKKISRAHHTYPER